MHIRSPLLSHPPEVVDPLDRALPSEVFEVGPHRGTSRPDLAGLDFGPIDESDEFLDRARPPPQSGKDLLTARSSVCDIPLDRSLWIGEGWSMAWVEDQSGRAHV